MRIGIVWKLFLLTTILCMLILATIYLGQTIFFKQYYENRKLYNIETSIKKFGEDYVKSEGNVTAIMKLEQDFYRSNNALITTLDSNGNLQNVSDSFVDVKISNSPYNKELANTVLRIPLYNLVKVNEGVDPNTTIRPGTKVMIIAIKKNNSYIPIKIQANNSSYWGNELILKQLNPTSLKLKFASDTMVMLDGIIDKIQDTTGNIDSNFKNTDMLFMEKIKKFQANLLLNEQNPSLVSMRSTEMIYGNVKYYMFIDSIQDRDGSTVYVCAIASLQPVDEAVQMMNEYYGYLVVLAMLLILLVSFYYSKKISRPLLQINKTTEKIANLNFSELVPIASSDEIGDLSKNINRLSKTLHSYIEKLHLDIEKEKQLERTRKEFISDVSHELKTPLSIMKSCVSILKDGVAYDKREHYFEAMEKEVDKMNLMIVDMLELARFESGTYKMEMDIFEIDRGVEQICEQLSHKMKQKQLQVQLQLPSVEVIANQHRIEQVITNFITNAIRYTPERGHIYISLMIESEWVKVSIENKGAHISEAQLDKVWDRFYRVDTSRKREQGGSGLGLAISKNILELHNVPYGVDNTENGVLFYFYLKKRV
ncbi:sensor histidine kinase [Brevibacillus sp. FIR094]|uniref:sensor histidine kinase n=1 Tax=Brevibacillus sp. FIR094 TaxID=3134809 RepID=UPI003D1E675D